MTKKIKKKEKHLYCLFNPNRHAADIAHPFCNFTIPDLILPPHMFINTRHNVSEETCSVCKAFKSEE